MIRYVSYDEWTGLVDKAQTAISRYLIDHPKVGTIYGVPRGGTLVALELGHRLNLVPIENPEEGCIVVDDLIDSGATMARYASHHFVSLITKGEDGYQRGDWIEFWYERPADQDIEDTVRRQLQYIGEDANRPGLKDTPRRVVKMWKEIYRGISTEPPKMTIFPNRCDGVTYDQMIVDTGEYYSMCEHHALPFFGRYWFTYIPVDKVVGLSKIARIVDHFAARLQVQERLTTQIVDYLEKQLEPLGIGLVMTGKHLCRCMRGVKKDGQMLTSDMRGVLRNKPEARNEFLKFVEQMR